MNLTEVQAECSDCGGGGVAGVVTRSMAMDAGDLSLEGYKVPCSTCGGDGWVIDVVEEEDPE